MAIGDQLSLASVDQHILYSEGLLRELDESENVLFEQQIPSASDDWLKKARSQVLSELTGNDHDDRDKLSQLLIIEDELATRHPAVA